MKCQIDIDTERVLTISQLASELDLHPRTVEKWAVVGILVDRFEPDGPRVVLESFRLTNGRATSWEAYKRFLAELNRETG